MQGLYTTKEISKMYRVPTYTVTQNWIPKGLKYMRGKKNGYLFKIEWIEEFLENNAIITISDKKNNIKSKTIISKGKCFVH